MSPVGSPYTAYNLIKDIVCSKDVLINVEETTIFKDRYTKYKVSALVPLYRSVNLWRKI